MKNLPENNFWNEIKDRLDHYAEEPADDSWDKIAGAINNTPQPRVIAWLERRASSAQVSLAGVAFLAALAAGDQPAATWNDAVENAGPAPAVVYAADENGVVNPDEETMQHLPANTEVVTSADIISEQENKQPSPADVTPHKRNINQSTSRKKNRRNEASHQQRTTYTDSDKTTSSETSFITQTEAPDTVRSGKPEHVNTVLSVATSPADTVAQKHADKDKKEAVVVNTREKKEAEKKEAQLHIPRVYFQVGPSLAFHKITPATNDDVTITDLEESGVFAADRAGFSVEAGFQYPVLPRLEVYGGLSYYQQNQNIRYTLAQAVSGGVSGSPDDGYVFTPVTSTHEVKYTMRNAGVSAGMFYRVKTHLLEHKLGVGLLYQQGFHRAAGEGSVYTNKGSKYWQYQLQYRMEAALNDHMRLYFQPGYTHAFHGEEKLNGPFTIKPYRAGISVGIVYLFKK